MEKILVIDDDHFHRSAAIGMLIQEWPDSEVISAPNGQIGFELATSEQPDLILLDWEMPGMSGYDVLLLLKSDPATSLIPVIMYTGIRTESEHLRRALEAGANEFLRKPSDQVELVARINSIQRQVEARQKLVESERKRAETKIKMQQLEMEQRQTDLASMALILEQKDQFLKSLLSDMNTLSKRSDNPSSIHKLRKKLEQEMRSDKNWEFIQVRMNAMHADFVARLLAKHPDLTKTELKLCSLMKLNLSQKETADILHISISGVEKQRYRLRKKLNIERSVRLENYIHSLTSPEKV